MKDESWFLNMSTRKMSKNCSHSLGIPPFVIILLLLVFLTPSSKLFAQSVPTDAFTVVLDAGHGGKDPGTVGKNCYEKNIALSIVKKLGYYIESLIPDTRVIYTRKTDVFVDLDVRGDIANRNHADLFISIHANSIPSGQASGTETWVMGVAKTQGNMDLVKKENEVILLEDDYTTKYAGYDPNNPASVISFAVMHNSFQDQSLDMASRVQDQFRTKAKRKDRGVKAGQFLVLWKTTMPSILIETGFISDPTEEAFLMSDYGQDLIASAIYRAFRDYKQDFDEKTTQDLASNASAVNNAVSNPQRRSSETTQTQDRIEVEKKQVVNDAGVGGKTENTSKSVTIEYSEPDLHFRVQILASQNQIPIDSKEFKGYSDLEELKIDGYFKYMSKPVASYAQALELRKQMVKTFPGAFVVGFKSGKKIPLMKAIEEDKKIH